jgi:hypothetical protein
LLVYYTTKNWMVENTWKQTCICIYIYTSSMRTMHLYGYIYIYTHLCTYIYNIHYTWISAYSEPFHGSHMDSSTWPQVAYVGQHRPVFVAKCDLGKVYMMVSMNGWKSTVEHSRF